LAAELVREQLFTLLGEEIPYATTAETEVFDEDRPNKAYIRVIIYTERQAHKPIILGEGGSMIKRIGEGARVEIEALLDRPVFLELWVKVRPKWRGDDRSLRQFGLKPPRNR
jgi:GTP-binding protein Era